MGFKPNSLFYSDGYKVGHKRMLAPGTNFLYGTWIPRSVKHAAKGITKILSFGQQLTIKWLHDEFKENFFSLEKSEVSKFGKLMAKYLGLPYDDSHFIDLWNLGYLPIKIKALPEGIETNPNIPHMTFINTKLGFAWLTLYLETIISALSWKSCTSATIALQYKRKATEWVMKTDPSNIALVDFLCHDFSARGTDPFTMMASGLGHALSFKGSDSLIVIPAAHYYYGEDENDSCINSVNASEHSVSTTKIFTVGEKQMIIDWLKEFPTGILSIVADTFDLWKLITEYLTDPEVKAAILARDGKLVIRPDSGDPVAIICGSNIDSYVGPKETTLTPVFKGVIELLWDEFGGTINEQGYKVLNSHIGAIYGDSINLERQEAIYDKLEKKGFACTNIVLGIGSFTYQYNTRDTLGFAAKGAWFESKGVGYNIYKDPITDDGTKVSLKGFQRVNYDSTLKEIVVESECTKEEEAKGLLSVIYQDGKFYNEYTLTEIRNRILKLV